MDAINELVAKYGQVVFDSVMREVIFEAWVLIIIGCVIAAPGIWGVILGLLWRINTRLNSEWGFPFAIGVLCLLFASALCVSGVRHLINPIAYVVERLM